MKNIRFKLLIIFSLFTQPVFAEVSSNKLSIYNQLVNSIEESDVTLAKKLIDKMGDTSNTTYTWNHLSPLTHAIKNDNEEIVEYLLKKGVDVNQKLSEKGPTPLINAAMGNNLTIVSLLLKYGANTGNTFDGNHTALTAALDYGERDEDIILKLISVTDVNIETKKYPSLYSGIKETYLVEDNTALLMALRRQMSDKVISALYKAGSKVGNSDEEKLDFLKAYAYKWSKQFSSNDFEGGIKSCHDALSRVGYSKDSYIQLRLILTLASEYEAFIITGKSFIKEDRALFDKLALENNEALAYLKMLDILKNAQFKNQDIELKEWTEKYQKIFHHRVSVMWNFSALKDWAKELSPEKKKRVSAYLFIFSDRTTLYDQLLNDELDMSEEAKANLKKYLGIK